MDVAASEEEETITATEHKQIDEIRKHVENIIKSTACDSSVGVTCEYAAMRNYKGLVDRWTIENCENITEVLASVRKYIILEKSSIDRSSASFCIAVYNYLAKAETLQHRVYSKKVNILESIIILVIVVACVQCIYMLCSDPEHVHIHT